MIDDWVNKEHTNLNMFSVVGEHIRSLSSKQSKFNFWNQLHQKIAFLCRFWTQTTTWRQNHTIWHQVSRQFWKLWLTQFFWDQEKGWSEFFINSWKFFQQERVLWGWLAGPSRTSLNINCVITIGLMVSLHLDIHIYTFPMVLQGQFQKLNVPL